MIVQNKIMNRMASVFLIFSLNSVFTYAYIYFLVGTFDVYELWNLYAQGIPHNAFLFDMMQYHLGASNASIEDAIIRLAVGSTAIHAVLLGFLFESDTLYSAVLINSFFVALIFWLLYNSVKASFFSYILLAPFFVFFSVGWTKEIIYTLALAFFMRAILVDSKTNLYLSFIVSLLSRPQFTPLLIVASLTKKVSKKSFVIFTLIIIAIAPIWLSLMPTVYLSAAQENYSGAGGQGISVYTDYLKGNIPILSIIGYCASVLKLYYEPLSALLVSIDNFFGWVEFYIEIVFLIILIRSRFNLFNNKIIFYLFLLINIFITSLPFTHFRYLLPMLVIFIIYNKVVISAQVELKMNIAGCSNG